MYNVHLPISKSIANRLLLLQAIHGDPLMRVSSDMPDDVLVLHDALEQLRAHRKGEPLTICLKNCGTALRFLEVHLEKCYPGEPITLTGDPRLMERKGKPTSQTASAMLMHGVDIPYSPDESPYITMTRKVMERYNEQYPIESDWSSASYWYEYVAIHGGELLLESLTADSIQGDRIVADIYAEYFGVQTTFTSKGAVVKKEASHIGKDRVGLSIDFTNCPDLYPAIALTCEKLGLELEATGTERLRYKESDRLEAVRLHEVRDDHRIAMALMAAGYLEPGLTFPERKELECVKKSYPKFVEQFNSLLSGRGGVDCSHITPIKGGNDDNLGKKHALSKLIHATTAEYVWLHDDDIILPKAVHVQSDKIQSTKADLIILPLKMESLSEHPSLLEKLQIAEYAAIQELTMCSAKKNRPVMCAGANLIVKREAWLACEPDLHPEIPSGDDMFLLEAMKRRGYKVEVIDDEDYTAVVRPITGWKAFFRQRMRWAGKAPHYTDRDIIRCGQLVVLANMLQILCPPIILVKFPIEYSLIKKREPHTDWYVALLLEIVYPFYLLVSLIGGLFRKEW